MNRDEPTGEFRERLLIGDAEAWQQFTASCRDKLVRVAEKITGNSHDAEDAVQEALTSCLAVLGKRQQINTLWGWLLSATRNRAIDRVRRRARRREIDASDSLPNRDKPKMTRDDADRIIEAALGKMTHELRQVYCLLYRERLTQLEAAKRLQCSVGTVKNRIREIQIALFKEIKHWD